MSEALKKLLQMQLTGQAGDASVTKTTPVAQSPEVIEMLRGRQKQADTNMLMAGASGALGELLFGGAGRTAQAGVDMMGGQMKRKQSLEDQETKFTMATEKAKMAGDKPTRGMFQQRPYYDDEGNIQVGSFNTATAQQRTASGAELGDKAKGLSPYIGKDPTTGELARVAKGLGGAKAQRISSADAKPQKFNIRQRKELKEIQKNVEQNPEYKASTASYAQSSRAIALLQSENDVADMGIKTVFPRMFGEKGNLSAAEQERFGGSPELLRKYLNLKARWFEGKLANEDRSDLIEVATVMGEFDRNNIENTIQGFITDASSLGDLTFDEIQSSLQGKRPKKMNPVKMSDKGKARAASMPLTVKEVMYKGKPTKMRRNNKGGWDILE